MVVVVVSLELAVVVVVVVVPAVVVVPLLAAVVVVPLLAGADVGHAVVHFLHCFLHRLHLDFLDFLHFLHELFDFGAGIMVYVIRLRLPDDAADDDDDDTDFLNGSAIAAAIEEEYKYNRLIRCFAMDLVDIKIRTLSNGLWVSFSFRIRCRIRDGLKQK